MRAIDALGMDVKAWVALPEGEDAGAGAAASAAAATTVDASFEADATVIIGAAQ